MWQYYKSFSFSVKLRSPGMPEVWDNSENLYENHPLKDNLIFTGPLKPVFLYKTVPNTENYFQDLKNVIFQKLTIIGCVTEEF